VRASRCASEGWSSSLHPSGISVPTLLQHAPSEPALLSWERFQVTMWSSLAPLLPCLYDTILGDISSSCVSVTNWVSKSSTRVICSALDAAYPTLRPLAFAFRVASKEYALVSTLRDAFGQDLPCVLLELHVT
jgi:hypothetical protein